MCFW